MAFLKGLKRFLFVAVVVLAVTAQEGHCDDSAEVGKDVQEEGRTFGHHFMKRISFALIPMMYKLGMMTTLLITLTIMSTKGLAVGVLLLILAISQIISRTFTAAPVPIAYAQQAVQPVVQYQQVPVVHKALPHAHVHVQPALHTHAYAHHSDWHGPYAREDTGEVEYEKKQ